MLVLLSALRIPFDVADVPSVERVDETGHLASAVPWIDVWTRGVKVRLGDDFSRRHLGTNVVLPERLDREGPLGILPVNHRLHDLPLGYNVSGRYLPIVHFGSRVHEVGSALAAAGEPGFGVEGGTNVDFPLSFAFVTVVWMNPTMTDLVIFDRLPGHAHLPLIDEFSRKASASHAG
jgi:hypothetical protein